jgi:hypothetical protein
LVEHAPETFVIPRALGEKFSRVEIVMLSAARE